MKIYIINLARSADRKLSMQQKIAVLAAADVPVEFIFFNAVDASAGQLQAFSGYFHAVLAKIHMARELTPGEKGCYASHFSLWQECIRLNEPIIVLEDDVSFADGFCQGVARIAASGYEYVRLIATFADKKPLVHLGDGFYRCGYDLAGAQGYYITPQAAMKFSRARYWRMPVDDYMDMSYAHGVANILHVPALLLNDDAPSTVGRESLPKSFIWKIPREIRRLVFQLRRRLYIMRHG